MEFHNGSGVWNASASFDLGLENSLNLTGLNIRVTPPNQTVAHSFEAGHFVNLLVSTSDGYLEEHTVIVRIPQIYSFEVVEEFMDDIIGVSAGETTPIVIVFKNAGNGDEKFTFAFDDSVMPDNWSAPSNTTHTLGPFVQTKHSIPITVPEGASDESFTIYINVSGNGDQVYTPITVNIQTSQPALRIDSHQLYGGGIDLVAYQDAVYYVNVTNTGHVDASQVQLNGTLCIDVHCDSPLSANGTETRDVPKSSTVTFQIMLDLSEISPNTYYIHFDISETGFGSVEDYPPLQVKVRSTPIEETTDWITWLLGGLLVVALLLLTRSGGGRRRSSAPF